jgi:hypothetical protein
MTKSGALYENLATEGCFYSIKYVAQVIGRKVVESTPKDIDKLTPILLEILEGHKASKTDSNSGQEAAADGAKSADEAGQGTRVQAAAIPAAIAFWSWALDTMEARTGRGPPASSKRKVKLWEVLVKGRDPEKNLDGLVFQKL